MKTVGLIGLGNAGKHIGQRLLEKGYSLKVYDIDPGAAEPLIQLGASKAGSGEEATSEITITVLPSAVEVKAAVFGANGILKGIRPNFILIDLSGTDPGCARELDQSITERQGHFLGGTLHASGAPAVIIPKGLLSIVIGGKRNTVEACMNILKDLAQKIICLPEPWMPKALKIAVIMFAMSNTIISAEVCAWLLAQGINPQLFLELTKITGSQSTASRVEEFFKRGRSYGGALSNSYKDLRQALDSAAELQIPLPFTATANQIQEMGRAQGFSRINSPAAIGKLYELLTGVDLSVATLDKERSFPEAKEPEVIYLENPLATQERARR